MLRIFYISISLFRFRCRKWTQNMRQDWGRINQWRRSGVEMDTISALCILKHSFLCLLKEKDWIGMLSPPFLMCPIAVKVPPPAVKRKKLPFWTPVLKAKSIKLDHEDDIESGLPTTLHRNQVCWNWKSRYIGQWWWPRLYLCSFFKFCWQIINCSKLKKFLGEKINISINFWKFCMIAQTTTFFNIFSLSWVWQSMKREYSANSLSLVP